VASEPGNWLDQALRRCWQILGAVAALILALHLLAAVLPWLLGGLGLAFAIYVVATLIRQRMGGW
jgi:hypothetical protein